MADKQLAKYTQAEDLAAVAAAEQEGYENTMSLEEFRKQTRTAVGVCFSVFPAVCTSV